MTHAAKAHQRIHTHRIFKLIGSMILTLLGFQLVFGQEPKADVRRLEPNQPLRREISGGEIHAYQFQIKKDDFIHIGIEPKGIFLVLKVRDAQGRELDSLNISDSYSGAGESTFSFAAERAGTFSLEVKTLDAKDPRGVYTIRADTPRSVVADDLKQISFERNEQVKRAEAVTLCNEALALHAKPESWQGAMYKAARGMDLSKDFKDVLPKVLCLYVTGQLHRFNQDKKKGLESFEKLLATIEVLEAKDQTMIGIEGLVVTYVGEAYLANRLYDELLTRFGKKLEAYQTRKEDSAKGAILIQLGNAQNRLHMPEAAESSYKEAAQVLQRTGDPLSMATALTKLGNVYYDRGNSVAALEVLLQAEKVFDQGPDVRHYQVERLLNLSQIRKVYLELGDDENLSAYTKKLQGLQINRQDKDLVVLNYIQLGNDLVAAEKFEEALKTFEEGLDYSKSFESIINTRNKIQLLEGILMIKLRSGKIDEVEDYVRQIGKLAEGLQDWVAMARLTERMADFFYEKREYKTAYESYVRSYQAVMKGGDTSGELNVSTASGLLKKMGKSLIRSGEVTKGMELVNASFWMDMIFRSKVVSVAENYDDLMTVYEELGNRRAAIFYGKQAIDLKQEIRQSVKALPIETQKSLLKGNRATYEKLITLLIQEDRREEAQQVINFYQNQEFYDQSDLPIHLTLTPREQLVRDVIRELSLKSKLTESDLKEKGEARTPDAQSQPGPPKVDLAGKLKEFGEEFGKPKDEQDVVTGIREVSDLRESLMTLSDKSGKRHAALYTFISREKFFVLLNLADEPLQLFESSVKAEELNRKLLQFYALLQSPESDPRVLGRHLYQIIIPFALEDKLRDKKIDTLMWSLDGNLRYLPVAALSTDGTRYLVERFDNIIFTRADKERMTKKVSRNWTGYGFFTSEPKIVKLLSEPKPIKFASLDANEAQIFRTKNYSNGIIDGDIFRELEFTEQSLLKASEQKRPLIHISSHFRFYPGNPELSFLLLGDGKVLTMSKIKEYKNLFQNVELLTLSACDTAAQFPNANGREIDGFAELAQRLGAGSVMASLWSVLDVSTTRLMNGFYRVRQGEGLTKAAALRKAQLNLLYGREEGAPDSGNALGGLSTKGNPARGDIFVEPQYRLKFRAEKGKPFAHPYYWSPFVLYGNPQ